MNALTAHVVAPSATVRAEVLTALRRAGVTAVPDPYESPDAVIVTAVDTVHEALTACPPRPRSTAQRTLLVADRFSPTDVVRVLRSGTLVMLRFADVTPSRLAAAVRAARDGEVRLPHEVLVGVLGGTGAPEQVETSRAAGRSPLTPRQTRVLALMAEGQDNAMIARSLLCSNHTVKNVIYDMMARLQVRNRAHAVACGVAAGLI
ncbi:LuxR C-terminal-related transcriptional regulator [Verrucosispora sp. WMMD573]|uniref:helix-turn-helix transcriptional regulator n=1 Tax=Verrucosispora sp. WMMD573 TaxID=3015149 RepID=UPI00248AB1F4|nr:LuxR C-terminal-related transcriptional regulator [Verrucosispora sp. WMMD573]WBB51971.1 LuxR C-terminal-related transcriptional regulator [Verrucosispora sp. WMMD573]